MAQTLSIRLSRPDNSPWGFRLQGGKDFGQPLLIQKVNGGSPAERAGLQVGDALIRVNNVEVADLRHKEAQDVIVRSGNSFELTVHRGGGSTWRPQVSPVGTVPLPGKASPATTVTKTSLAASGRSPVSHIGAGHNLSPKPFGGQCAQVNGDPSVKAIVNKQYNTPVQMYSEETIAETLSAQAEVLAGGAIGVNFMKNEKSYDSQKSEVFKMVQEVDKEPREPETPDASSGGSFGLVGGLRHVQPPEPKPSPASPQQLPPGQNICADCERLIVGVFVRIKDKNLHVECFKCATCGTSLKNVGYYNINNKLYCDIHAKLVARQNPPAPNLEPVTVPPGGRLPSGAFSVPQTQAGPQSPQPGTLAPLPFHTSAPSGPKPFSSVPAPSTPSSVPFTPSVISPPASAPFSSVPVPPPPSSFSKPSPDSLTPVIWPPVTPTHLLKTGATSFSQHEEKRLSICSEEVSKIASKVMKVGSTILEEERPCSPVPEVHVVTQAEVERGLVEAGERVRQRTPSPRPPHSPRSHSPRPMTPRHFQPVEPDLLDVSSRPHEVHSLLPPASAMHPLSPKQVIVFPPEMPAVVYSRSPTPKQKRSPDRLCPSPLNALVPYQSCKESICSLKSEQKQTKVESCKYKKETCQITENTVSQIKGSEKHLDKMENLKTKKEDNSVIHSTTSEKESSGNKMDQMFYSRSEVEKIIHEEVLKALSMKEKKKVAHEEKTVLSVHDLPKSIAPTGWMTTALTTASERPFTPVPFPKPLELPSLSEKIVPMEPVQIQKEEKAVPLPKETTPYFPPPPPPPGQEALNARCAQALREVGCRSPLTEALTIAPDRPYSPLPSHTELKGTTFKPIPDKEGGLAAALTVAPSVPFTIPGQTPIPAPLCKEKSKSVGPKPFSPQESAKFGIDFNKIAERKQTKETIKNIESGKIMKSKCVEKLSHAEKHLIPYYQENIGEIPVRNRAISPVPHPIVAPSVKPTIPYVPQPYNTKMDAHVSRKEAHEQTKKSQSEKVEFLQTRNVPPRPTTPSGLHPPQDLPYYQQNMQTTPLKNKSVSPTPHVIKTPQVDPAPAVSQSYKSKVYSETKTYTAQKSSSKTLTTNVCSTTTNELVPSQNRLSPQHWKLETKRTVQNLSPITVRLPSPRPVTPVQGEILQAARAKVEIHCPRPSSPLPPKIKVEVDYPEVPSSGLAPGQISAESMKVLSPGPSIGSEKSAFTAVKNGSGQAKKIIESSVASSKMTSSAKSTEVCQQKTSNQISCSKGQIAGSQVVAQEISQIDLSKNQQSKSSREEKSLSTVLEKKGTIHRKATQSGITSFRAYGETTNKTLKNEENVKSSSNVQVAQAVHSKTFADSTECSEIGCRPGGQGKERSCIKVETCPKALTSKGTLPRVVSTACPLPTFPSLPSISDVPPPSGAGGRGTLAGSSAPKRGRGILNQAVSAGGRIPLCGHCNSQIRGPFITALGKIWCPEHFVCVNTKCRRPLQDIGFVEEQDGLYCEYCFEQYLAPTCDKCHSKIKGDCLNAIGKHFHPECFSCAYCGKLFGNNPFFLEDALPYCENDWNELFTTKCFSCGFPIEAGDRWVEALNNNYHSQCFNCTMCKKNLEGQSFFAKAGRPFCKNHAR